MRRTVTLEVELDGPIPEALDLRDAVLRISPRYGCKVVRAEVVDDGVGKP